MPWLLTALVLGCTSWFVSALIFEGRSDAAAGSLARRLKTRLAPAASYQELAARAAGALKSLLAGRIDALRGFGPARLRRRGRVRFEDCVLLTAPDVARSSRFDGSLPVLEAVAPASRGWLSRLVAALELVLVVLIIGGLVGAVVIAAAWKAHNLF